MNNQPLTNSWIQFYNQIKDSSWPEIKTQTDVLGLPEHILNEILFQHGLINVVAWEPGALKSLNEESDKLDLDSLRNSVHFDQHPELVYDQKFLTNDITVCYHQSLDGGGSAPNIGQRYSHVIAQLYPNRVFGNCYEWCSGPGFIGFDLLSRNICNNLYVSDIYYPAIESVKATIEYNKERCDEHVFYHHSQQIADLPKDWRFDLVVSNPPWWNPSNGRIIVDIEPDLRNRISADDRWELHSEFYSNIRRHLNPDGIILLQEGSYASGPEDFAEVIEKNGMYINDCYWETYNKNIYYLEVKQRN